MDMDTALLRAFVAVADSLDVSRAAQELGLTPETVRRQLVQLQAGLCSRVVVPAATSGAGGADSADGADGADGADSGGADGALLAGPVQLTTAGRDLIPLARQVLDGIDRIGGSDNSRRALVVDLMDEHAALLPRARRAGDEVSFATRVVFRPPRLTALASVLDGVADVAFGRPAPAGGSRGVPVLAEEIQLLVPAGHPLDAPGPVTADEVAGHRLRFPLTAAPVDWVEWLAAASVELGWQFDDDDAGLGFAHWLPSVMRPGGAATLIGAGMQLPVTGLDASAAVRRRPVVEPIPVFWWWATWNPCVPGATVHALLERLAGDDAVPADPDAVWLPPEDRARLAELHRQLPARGGSGAGMNGDLL